MAAAVPHEGKRGDCRVDHITPVARKNEGATSTAVVEEVVAWSLHAQPRFPWASAGSNEEAGEAIGVSWPTLWRTVFIGTNIGCSGIAFFFLPHIPCARGKGITYFDIL